MKKMGYIISLVALLIVYGLANLILFLVLPDGRTEMTTFWVSWSFAFPFCFLTSIGVTIFCARNSALTIAKVPLLYPIQYAFSGIYLLVGIIFWCFKNEAITAVWVVEAIVSGAFIILMLYAWFGIAYLTKNIEHTKQKVFYIRSLQADIDACIPQVSDSALANQLRELSEKIRFSDPMSHESLKPVEARLQDAVERIVVFATTNSYESLPQLIAQAKADLDLRNGKCKLLK